MKSIKVGVIGVGTMGERHCRIYSSLRHVDFVGIADLNAELGHKVAASYETEYFGDCQSLLERVDAISIVTTTPAHFELAVQALEQGIHVLIEKPITETVAQAEKLIEMASGKGCILQVGHIERFNPAYSELKNVVNGMRLIGVNVRRLSSFDASNTDVDVVRDLMIHDLDLITNLLGQEFEYLTAWGRSASTDATDHAVANISYTNGPIATLFASRVTEQKVRSIEVVADGAYVEADLLSKNLLIHRRTFPQYVENQNAAKYRQESVIERIHVPMVEPLLLELKHFIACAVENKPSSVPGSDGLYALKLAEQITQQIHHSNGLGHVLKPVYVNGVTTQH